MNSSVDMIDNETAPDRFSDALLVRDDQMATAKEAAPNAHLLNAVKNGSRLRPLNIGDMPKLLERVERAAREYRRYLEAAVLEARGEISHICAHWIDEAVSWSIHADICRWLLRQKLSTMTECLPWPWRDDKRE